MPCVGVRVRNASSMWMHKTGKWPTPTVTAAIRVWWRGSGISSPVPALWLTCAPGSAPAPALPLSSVPLQAFLTGNPSAEEPTTPSFKEYLARVRKNGAALYAQPGKTATLESHVTKASGKSQHKENPLFVKQTNRKTQEPHRESLHIFISFTQIP